MAITLDTSVIAHGNGVNSFNFGALTTAETDEVLVCGIHFSNQNTTGITFSSLSWTLIGNVNVPTAGGEIFVYYAKAPSVLAASVITATFTGGNFPQCSGIIQAWKGCDVTTPIGANSSGTTGSGTTVTGTYTSTVDNSQGIGYAGQTAVIAMGVGASQTEITEVRSVGSFSRSNAMYRNSATTPAGTSVSMDATTGSNVAMAIWAVELCPPVVASTGNNVFMTTNTKFF